MIVTFHLLLFQWYIYIVFIQIEIGVMTNGSLNQWIELLDVSDACLVRPETCSEGASLTVWIKILDYVYGSGIISSRAKSPFLTNGIWIINIHSHIR